MSRQIIAIVDDLFFAAKIRGTAEQVGATAKFPRTIEAAIEAVANDHRSLILCDLHAQRIDPNDLARTLKSDDKTRDIALVGFFSHVNVELQRTAIEAGFDRVIPRSVFARDLVQILRGDE